MMASTISMIAMRFLFVFSLFGAIIFAFQSSRMMNLPSSWFHKSPRMYLRTNGKEIKMMQNEAIDYYRLLTAVDWSAVFDKATRKALNGGTAGASAAAFQVLSLMWLRTTINYQYRYGKTTQEALTTLYQEGVIPRFYQGLPLALLQGPLSRFGDTAANALALTFYASFDTSSSSAILIPLFIQTGTGSLLAGIWRIFLMPIDTGKTTLQVNGANGWIELKKLVSTQGVSVLYNGAIAASLATIVGHFPWFYTYNYLSEHLPTATDFLHDDMNQGDMLLLDSKSLELVRSAFIGLCASSLSDTCSNSLRVLKTAKQTMSMTEKDNTSNKKAVSYLEIAQRIVQEDGWSGLFGRGLQTRLAANAIQGVVFSVLFKYFQSK